MRTAEVGTWIRLKNILYLTDFSKPSADALPFAIAISRGHRATVHALHVFISEACLCSTPEVTLAAIEAAEENALAEMRRVESQLVGQEHDAIVERGLDVWVAVEQAIKDHDIDLVVVGTHGRTGAEKFLLGSVAEEIFRRSPVPVLTIGPGVRCTVHNGGRFHRVLFATDFAPESTGAAPYAVSLAQENQARLALLTVMRNPKEPNGNDETEFELSVAEAIHQLYEVIPKDAKLDYPAEIAVEYGEPGERIVEAANRRGADLIVLGVRNAERRIGAATHLERATAHKVVAHAACPVLTVRG